MSITLTDNFNLTGMDNWTAADGVLDSCHIGVFTNSPTLTNATVLSDLTEPSYSGYARQALTFVSVYQQPDGSMAISSALSEFQMSDSMTPTTIMGYFISDNSPSTQKLLGAEMLPQSVPLATSLDALLISAQISLGSDSGNGSATIID